MADIQDLKREFKSKYKYIANLTEAGLDSKLSSAVLKDAKSILPQMNKNNITELRQLQLYKKNCDGLYLFKIKIKGQEETMRA